MQEPHFLSPALAAQAESRSVGGLLLLMVLLIHFWLVRWFMQTPLSVNPAQPLVMEVAMILPQGGQAPLAETAAPQANPKPKEPVKAKTKPQKIIIPKPVKKKTQPLPKKAPPEKPKPLSDTQLSARKNGPETHLEPALVQNRAAPVAPSPAPVSVPQAALTPYQEANFTANYGINPKPHYPSVARSRGWEGQVLLRVRVTAQGLSETVTVQRSSGHDLLDESAVEAVKKWQFIPAKRGAVAVASTVIVPIIFTLKR